MATAQLKAEATKKSVGNFHSVLLPKRRELSVRSVISLAAWRPMARFRGRSQRKGDGAKQELKTLHQEDGQRKGRKTRRGEESVH